MLKRILLISIFTLLTCSFVQAEENPVLPTSVYNPEQNYSGLFKGDRVYAFNPYEETWYGDRQFKTLSAIQCSDALTALSKKGIWVGNLDNKGRCSAPAEAGSRATGNYLNFMIKKSRAQ